MFDRICAGNVVIASQQRGEPDFTAEQKHEILQRLYSANPANFVYRFGSLLTDDDLHDHFDPNADYIRHIATPNRHKLRANRRYAYMQQLLTNGTYFSDEAMKERSPLLYEQMVGRYDDGSNPQKVTRTASGPLADFYMEHLESMNHQERVEEEFEQEARTRMDESDDEEDDDDDDEACPNAEREMYRQEFLAIQKGKLRGMRVTWLCVCVLFAERFLNGEDTGIDYASIDNNDNLDDVKTRERDEEEKYFDDD